ncbi:MAG: prepilin-type N-terminal cleavage/methylation domain-containing protein [Planctomycetota bacterium]|jgi:prepilin-type N-terminal cleavage/methylation domain-containing protein|nr:prepilin-type N-terminal cleavage/methylation domain-containing protein [Planctomycetota bacterium]
MDQGTRGFTLIEMLVTVMVISLGMTMIMNYDAVLPQARLASSASSITSDLRRMRNHALLTQREVVFAYHISENSYEAWYPVEMDEDGRIIGPGITVVLDPKELETDTALESIRLADRTIRDEGDVEFRISPLGRIAPHRLLVLNPEYPELERRWIDVDGMINDAQILSEIAENEEVVSDATFR